MPVPCSGEFRCEKYQKWHCGDRAGSGFCRLKVPNITRKNKLALQRKEPLQIPEPARLFVDVDVSQSPSPTTDILLCS